MKKWEEFFVGVRHRHIRPFVHSNGGIIHSMDSDNMLLFVVAEEEIIHDRKVEKGREKINSPGGKGGVGDHEASFCKLFADMRSVECLRSVRVKDSGLSILKNKGGNFSERVH